MTDQEFFNTFVDELIIRNHPKAEIFFNLCWDASHDSGYQAVIDKGWEWVILLR